MEYYIPQILTFFNIILTYVRKNNKKRNYHKRDLEGFAFMT